METQIIPWKIFGETENLEDRICTSWTIAFKEIVGKCQNIMDLFLQGIRKRGLQVRISLF